MADKEILIIEGASVENPAYVSHKRGRNWAAILRGPNAAKMEREYLSQRGAIVDLGSLKRGDALELGGDYITSGGNRHPDRRYYAVHARTETELLVELCSSAAQAIRTAREIREADTALERTPTAPVLVALSWEDASKIAQMLRQAGEPSHILQAFEAVL